MIIDYGRHLVKHLHAIHDEGNLLDSEPTKEKKTIKGDWCLSKTIDNMFMLRVELSNSNSTWYSNGWGNKKEKKKTKMKEIKETGENDNLNIT